MIEHEKWLAIREGHFNAAVEEYFRHRPDAESPSNSRVFYAGHCCGYEATTKLEAELAAFKKIDKVLVDRFLNWRLPHDFAPDCGITFDGCPPDALGYAPSWPVGTNLLTADQARAMIKYIIRGKEGK